MFGEFGAQIDFLTIRRKPIDPRAERRLVSAEITRALAIGMIHAWLLRERAAIVEREYRRSLVTVEHSEVDNGTSGSFSTRRRVQEIASVCRNASAVTALALQRQSAGPEHHSDALRVLVPENFEPLPTDDAGFDKLFGKYGEMERLAFLWQPLGRVNRELQRLMTGPRPPFLRTVYLLDLNKPLRLTIREFGRMRVNAGPWFGHWFALLTKNQIRSTTWLSISNTRATETAKQLSSKWASYGSFSRSTHTEGRRESKSVF